MKSYNTEFNILQWTKFIDSPTSSLSSPGPKPVNFDFQKSSVEQVYYYYNIVFSKCFSYLIKISITNLLFPWLKAFIDISCKVRHSFKA